MSQRHHLGIMNNFSDPSLTTGYVAISFGHCPRTVRVQKDTWELRRALLETVFCGWKTQFSTELASITKNLGLFSFPLQTDIAVVK